MAVSTFPAPSGSSVPNWTLLQTATPSGVTSVTFSSLSGYSKYRVVAIKLGAATAFAPILQCNGDSGSNYSYYGTVLTGTTWIANAIVQDTSYHLTNANGNALAAFDIDIDHALLLAPKIITSHCVNGLTIAESNANGSYQTSSLLTSITIADLGGHSFNNGSIYLYGVN